jgi:tetratricopeptide (TPR) repeat protein
LYLGIAHAYRSEPQDSLCELEEALRCEPGLAAAHLWTAIVHMDLEEFEKSVASLDRAVELEDTSAEVLHRRAMAKHCSGRLREAVRDYSETLRTAGVDA